jgi:hypothetical protein
MDDPRIEPEHEHEPYDWPGPCPACSGIESTNLGSLGWGHTYLRCRDCGIGWVTHKESQHAHRTNAHQ